MSGETSGGQPPAGAPDIDVTEPAPNGANREQVGGEVGEATAVSPPVTAPVSTPPKRRRRWLTGLMIALLVLNLAASAVAIGWIAWIVTDQPRWLDEIQGPQGDRGATGEQGPQGDVGPQGEQGEVGEPGSSADVDTLNVLAGRLAAVETDLASNDLGLEAQRLSTRLEQVETQVVDLCDRLRDNFQPVDDVCPAGEPGGG